MRCDHTRSYTTIFPGRVYWNDIDNFLTTYKHTSRRCSIYQMGLLPHYAKLLESEMDADVRIIFYNDWLFYFRTSYLFSNSNSRLIKACSSSYFLFYFRKAESSQIHQCYFLESAGMKPRMKNHYRAHQLSVWLRLVPELHRAGMEDVEPKHNLFRSHADSALYDGSVRPDPLSRIGEEFRRINITTESPTTTDFSITTCVSLIQSTNLQNSNNASTDTLASLDAAGWAENAKLNGLTFTGEGGPVGNVVALTTARKMKKNSNFNNFCSFQCFQLKFGVCIQLTVSHNYSLWILQISLFEKFKKF